MLTLDQKIDFIYEAIEDLIEKVSSAKVLALEEENRDLRNRLDEIDIVKTYIDLVESVYDTEPSERIAIFEEMDAIFEAMNEEQTTRARKLVNQGIRRRLINPER